MKTCRKLSASALLLLLLLAIGALAAPIAAAGDVVTSTIPTGSGPYAVAVNPVQHRAYVANYWDYRVSVINTASDTVEAQVPVAAPGTWPFPISIAVNPNTNKVYVVNWFKGDLVVINGATNAVETSIPVGYSHANPRAVVVNPSTNKVYVANYSTDIVYAIEGNPASPNYNSVVAAIPVKTNAPNWSQPRAIAVNPNLNRIYTGNGASNDVSVIDGDPTSPTYHQMIASVPAGTGPRAISVNPDNGKVYVANITSNNVTVINGVNNTAEATIGVGTSPRGIDINTTTNKIYVANYGSDNVSIINGATNAVSATVAAGSKPRTVAAVNSPTGNAYVANYGSTTPSTVTIINSSDMASSLGVGLNPVSVAIDALLPGIKVFVANWGSNSVTVIDPPANSGSPLVSSINPLPGNATPSTTPVFTGTAVNHRAPFNSNITTVLYQIDSLTGPWQKATITGGAGSPSVTWQATTSSPLDYGPHTIHVAALDATGATISSSDGNASNSPSVGDVASYSFKVGVSDTTPPDIVNLTPLRTYIYKAPMTLGFYATDEQSGVASTAATLNGRSVLSGQTVTLDQVGKNTLTITATDNAGNSRTSTYTFDVAYDVKWLPPLKYVEANGGYTHTLEVDDDLAIKWSMYDYYGKPVIDPAVVLIISDRADPGNAVTFIQGVGEDRIRYNAVRNFYKIEFDAEGYPWIRAGGVYDIKIGRVEGFLLELLTSASLQVVADEEAEED